MKFRIEDRFKNLDTRTPKESDLELRESIVQNGCIVPVVVWSEEGVLLDGHRRAAVCEELGRTPPIVYRSFPDAATAATWVLEQQRTRRNLTDDQFKGRRAYEAARVAMLLSSGADPGESAQAIREAAEAAGVSESTIRRDVRRAIISSVVKDGDEAADEGGGEAGLQVAEANDAAALNEAADLSVESIPSRSIDEIVKQAARKGAKSIKDAVKKAAAGEVAAVSECDRLAEEFDSAIKYVDRAMKEVRRIAKIPELAPILTMAVITRIGQHLKDARAVLSQCTPVKHDRCIGIGCEFCGDKGWVTRGNNGIRTQ